MTDRILFSLKNYRAAILAAVFFGAIAPGAKLLVGNMPPQSLAGTMYLGAGFGLFIFLIFSKEVLLSFAQFHRRDFKWLIGATVFGGILGPAFLTYGLMRLSGSTASLLLNLESVLTSVIAWSVFKEHFEKKIVWGMLFIIAGCLVLSINSGQAGGLDTFSGVTLIALACLSWGIDNNLTRNISHLNPLLSASFKGIIAGSSNLLLGCLIGESLHFNIGILYASILGLLGVGISLIAFIFSLGKVGTVRTGALFSTAPFVGSIFSILFLKEPVTGPFLMALLFIAIGVWFHLSEDHCHEHTHHEMEHSHGHVHDEHHQHEHSDGVNASSPHTHSHKHENLTHRHPHFPDIHHQHSH